MELNNLENVEFKRQAIKNILITTADSILGPAEKSNSKSWFEDECRYATEDDNQAYQSMHQKRFNRNSAEEYKSARRRKKRIYRKKKRIYIEEFLKDAEHLRGSGESRAFYKTINNNHKDFKSRITFCRDKNGYLLSNSSDIAKRWMEHFNDLLNDDQGPESFEETVLAQSGDNFSTPTLKEEELAIGKLQLNKSPGPDSILAVFFKRGCPVLNSAILEVTLAIWEDEVLPMDSWYTVSFLLKRRPNNLF